VGAQAVFVGRFIVFSFWSRGALALEVYTTYVSHVVYGDDRSIGDVCIGIDSRSGFLAASSLRYNDVLGDGERVSDAGDIQIHVCLGCERPCGHGDIVEVGEYEILSGLAFI